MMLVGYLHNINLADKKLDINKRGDLYWNLIGYVIIYLILYPIVFIISQFVFDVVTIFSGEFSYSDIYRDGLKDFFSMIYIGAFGTVAFLVTLFVAYVRYQGVKNSEEQFKHAQEKDFAQGVKDNFKQGFELISSEDIYIRIAVLSCSSLSQRKP